MTDDCMVVIGDCVRAMADLPERSVDAIVTDPPYELHSGAGRGFMGKTWDGSGVSFDPATWAACLRVLRPGGHLLAFGGTRTVHRIAVAIEDAGFEIRDQIVWLYGSGFPKSLDVSKAMDKQRHGGTGDLYRVTAWIREQRDRNNLTNKQIDEAAGTNGMAGHWTTAGSQPEIPTLEQWTKIAPLLGDAPDWMMPLLKLAREPGEAWYDREVIGETDSGLDKGSGVTVAFTGSKGRNANGKIDVTAPATGLARKYAGFGTALKPAHEPVIVARKPLIGTVAANVAAHGTGALNIDGCRIPGDNPSVSRRNGAVTHLSDRPARETEAEGRMASRQSEEAFRAERPGEQLGRWPANVALDEEAAAMLDGQSGTSSSRRAERGEVEIFKQDKSNWRGESTVRGHTDSGGASRFFYVAKASRSERNAGLDGMPEVKAADRHGYMTLPDQRMDREQQRLPQSNHHPTVKPIALMRWLVRLVTPVGGVVLDPFMGSGTTGCAARMEGFRFIGIEQDAEYAAIADRRIRHWAELG